MRRRDFLIRSSLVLSTAFFSRARLRAALQEGLPHAPGVLTALRRGVGVYTARGGTIGWLANADALVAVDSQFPASAEDFWQALSKRRHRALEVLINTHHHPDHTAGNTVLGPVARRHVAHVSVPELQRARAEADCKLQEQTYASELLATSWQCDAGNETLTVRHLGPAHTAGDVVVHFERADVVHLGDLVFNRVYPVIDRLGGASLRNWISVLDELVKMYSADTRFIFGHARTSGEVVGRRADIIAFRDFLLRLQDLVRSEIVMGKPRVQVLARESLPGYADWSLPHPQRFRDALGAVYDEFVVP